MSHASRSHLFSGQLFRSVKTGALPPECSPGASRNGDAWMGLGPIDVNGDGFLPIQLKNDHALYIMNSRKNCSALMFLGCHSSPHKQAIQAISHQLLFFGAEMCPWRRPKDDLSKRPFNVLHMKATVFESHLATDSGYCSIATPTR